jgi:hypothetical protein
MVQKDALIAHATPILHSFMGSVWKHPFVHSFHTISSDQEGLTSRNAKRLQAESTASPYVSEPSWFVPELLRTTFAL